MYCSAGADLSTYKEGDAKDSSRQPAQSAQRSNSHTQKFKSRGGLLGHRAAKLPPTVGVPHVLSGLLLLIGSMGKTLTHMMLAPGGPHQESQKVLRFWMCRVPV